MSNVTNDTGFIEVLLDRTKKQRLSRLLAINAKTDSREALDDMGVEFLKTAMADAIVVVNR